MADEPTTPPSRFNPTPPPAASSSSSSKFTDADMHAALQAFKAMGTAAPTSHGVSAPSDQRAVVFFKPDGTLDYKDNPNYDANAPPLTVYGSADGGYFRLDKQGNPVAVQQPNADSLIEKAVERQVKEGDRNARQRNLETTGFYGTDAERATFENNARARGLDADRIKLDRDKFNVEARQKDVEEKRLSDMAVASIAKTGAEVTQLGATTALTGAQTTQTAAQTAALTAKTPAEIEEMQARAKLAGTQGDLARQQIEDLKRKAGMPTIEDLGTGPTYGVMGPTGQIEQRVNQNYVPKTSAEVQARVGQIDALAQQKKAEILEQFKDNPSAGLAAFTKWHEQNVAPHVAGLQAAMEDAAIARGKDLAVMRTAAQTAALGAGTQRISEYNAQTGPGFAEEFGKLLAASAAGKRPEGIDYTKMLTRDPINAEQATAQALKYIDPTAAQLAGAGPPTWQQTNPADALAMSRYMPAGGGPAAAAVAGPAAVADPTRIMDGGTSWQRADQNPGPTPAGNALAQPGQAGTVPVGSPTYLGVSAAEVEAQQAAAAQAELEAQQQAAQAQTTGDLQALMGQLNQNDQYVPQLPAARAPVIRRRPAAVAAPAPIPFYQQALAAGLGAGGLGNENYVPPSYVYGGLNPSQQPW